MKLPPQVFHLAEAANWPSIKRSGLLPATELIARAALPPADRDRLQRHQRTIHTVLPGGCEIRDQRPMPDDALRRCLVDLTPADWYTLINSRVFFWLDPARLNRQRTACGSRPQIVLTIDTEKLLQAYHQRVSVSPINTGNARRRPARRGAATFVPYATWTQSAWITETRALGTTPRTRSHKPAELTVQGSIPDAQRYILDVCHLPTGRQFSPP